jgi:predicted ATPase
VVYAPLAGTGGDGPGRYRLLEMVRQYAAEALARSGEQDRVRARHRDWYLALAEAAEAELRGADQEHWLWRLDAEYDNLRSALAGSLGGIEGSGLRVEGSDQPDLSLNPQP